nr:MAG TPA: NTP-PPase-like protein [Caudoviricetes sp.]
MNTIEKVKQWFIDRDLENGGRLDKQSLKLSEEFGELCAGYLKKNEKLTKDSIGDCAVVSIQLKMLFYKRLRNFTTDRFLTFSEYDWKFLISDLVNEFVR